VSPRQPRKRAGDGGSDALRTGTLRVGIYLRISTDEEHQPFSLDAQQHRLRSFIASQPGWVHVDTYEDQISGAKADRPALDRALKDARLGRFDILLVYRVDRFARSLKILVHLLEELEAAGVGFRSATEPIDTSSPTGRMLVQLLGVFAEFERATIIDRVINGMERKAARGAWLGGRIPYGLALDTDKRLRIEPGEFPLINRIFDRYTNDHIGATTIASELNSDGYRTRMGRPWGTKGILDILRNRSYLGEVYFREKWYTNGKDPFVDPSLFERTQDLLDKHGEGYAERFGNRHPEYVLAGLIICNQCKGRYVGACATGKRHRYRYYVCSTRQRFGVTGCKGERIRADELEEAVFDALVDLYSNPQLLVDAADEERRLAVSDSRGPDEELATVRSELRKTEAAVERYMGAFENGALTDKMFGERVRDLGTKAETLRDRQATLLKGAAEVDEPLPTAVEVDKLRRELETAAKHALPPVRKALAQSFVHELRVETRERVIPTFKVIGAAPDELAAGQRVDDPSTTVGVRPMSPLAVPTGFEPVSPP
jgi:site-specific DNA recombinase